MATVHDEPTAQIVEALRAALCQVAEPTAVLAAILEQAVTRTGADRGLLAEVLDDGEMCYRVLHGFHARSFEGDAGAFSRQLFGRVVQTGEEVLLERAADDPYFGRVGSVQSLGTAAILCMPIRAGRSVAAVVHLEHRKPAHFRPEHRELLRSLLAVAGPTLGALRAGREVIQERDRLQLSERRFRQEAEESRDLLARDWSFGRFVGRSAVVRELETSVQEAARTDFPVVIFGETGTGKSILARVIHHGGRRTKGPFVTVSCPNLEKGMLEAELFGHRRGAFTGAVSDRAGKVHAADGGTLFLDEIGELPLEIQPKLLRLLDQKKFERVGDSQEQTADVRIIAATNRDLEVEVEHGRFRRDLFERLNFLLIHVPPLRERPEDIPLLLRYSLDQTESGRWIEVTPEASRHLEQLDSLWGGNVRHIEQLAARLVAEGRDEPVSVQDVERLLRGRKPRGPEGTSLASGDRGENFEAGLPANMAEAERAFLEKALRLHAALTRAQLAAKLKISEPTLFRKLRQYGLIE